MRRRDFLQLTVPLLASTPSTSSGEAILETNNGSGVQWKPTISAKPDLPAFVGFTDCVPDIVGTLGRRIDLAIFTEGNHFPALLGQEILTAFRKWAAGDGSYAHLPLENIVIVTLPQPIIVSMIRNGGIVLGNLTISVDREGGFYPDIVMGGRAPLKALRLSKVIGEQARVFAKNRGPALLVRAGNPHNIVRLNDLTRPEIRLVLATSKEPGAREQYISALDGMMGHDKSTVVQQREIVDFPGRLGIQHRDVLQALSIGVANVGIIVRHLAQYFAITYPEICQMVAIEGADKFSSTIALAPAQQPLRPDAAQAFTKFFLDNANEVYPKYGFAQMATDEYGATILLN